MARLSDGALVVRASCGAVALAVAVWSGVGVATPAARSDAAIRERCAEAAESAQAERAAGRLLAARERFAECVRPACPGVIREDCSRWSADVTGEIPRLTLSLERAPEGAVISIDGEPRAEGVLELDPGTYRIVVRAPGHREYAAELRLEAGQAPRFAPALERLPPPARRRASEPPATPSSRDRDEAAPFAWAAVGGGTLLLGAGLWTGVSANAEANALRRRCAPGCDSRSVEELRSRLLAADVLMVGGAAGILLGGWWLLWPSRRPVPRAEVAVAVAPGSALAAVRGSY